MNRIVVRGLVTCLFLSLIFFLISCSKKNTSFDYNQAIATVSDYVESQQMTDLLLNTYFKSITDSILLTDGTAEIDGADVSYSIEPSIIVIDYPGWGNDDGYGHFRKGKYEATTETSFFDSLAVVNFTFYKFAYDFDSVSVANLSIVNKGSTNDGNYLFDIVATDIYREFHDTSGYIRYQLQQMFLRTKFTSSPYYSDNDYFEISGNLSGVARNGNSFNSIIQDTNSLRNSFSCNWINGGMADIELPDFIYSAKVDFSNDGKCLNQYSIITNETLLIKAFDVE